MSRPANHDYALPAFLQSAPAAILGVAALYAGVARLSILFSFQSSRITPIFPAAGIALAAALILGRPGLLGVWLGAIVTVTLSGLAASPFSPHALASALMMGTVGGTGAMAGAWAGASLVRRFTQDAFPLGSGWNVLVLLSMGAIAGGAVSPTVGVLSLTVGGVIPWSLFGLSWVTWWVGDAAGVVVAAPLLLAWLHRDRPVFSFPKALEALVLTAATGLVCHLIFFRNLNFEFALLPLLLWAAFRFGARGATSMACIITITATLGTSRGLSPFARGTVTDSLLRLHFFLAVTVFCALLLAGLLAERIQAQRSLSDSEAQKRGLLSAIPDLIFLIGKDLVFQDYHAYDPRLLFAPPESFLQHTVQEVLPSPFAELLTGAYWRALKERAVQELRYALPTPQGDRQFEARVAPCDEEQVLAIVRDVTEKHQTEQSLRELQAQLLQAQKMESLGSLAGGVAHDMNNVLGAIQAMASAHQQLHAEGSQVRQAFDTISEAAARGGDMVRCLLNFARQNPAESLELDLNAILQDEVRLLKHTTLSRITLVLELASGLHPVKGDRSALTHAFMNLCVNAVDAMPGHGTLTLRTANRDAQWVEVQVEDDGCGMPPEVLARALDPFYTTKEVGKGTGLGLSMVYSTVKAHQGELELRSEPGRGTRVLLRFPACRPETQAGRPAQGEEAAAGGRSLRVLLVDDDDLIRESAQFVLEVLGHTSLPAASGEEALALLAQGEPPDVVILDMHMPGLAGAGTLPLLRERHPHLPVLLSSGRVDAQTLELAATWPDVTIAPKPFSLTDMRKFLEPFNR